MLGDCTGVLDPRFSVHEDHAMVPFRNAFSFPEQGACAPCTMRLYASFLQVKLLSAQYKQISARVDTARARVQNVLH
jgi:hypothetical protein